MTVLLNRPLVSIIVRTKDRPEFLKTALRSIASQTYRPIEVVLVNDGGCELNVVGLNEILGNVALNYIRLEKNMGRAHAGNMGIENARGKYIGFLDDDDEFYHHHVETLVGFLGKSGYKAVYSATEMVFQNTSPKEERTLGIRKEIFSKAFSYRDLLAANYIPLNSILFNKELLTAFKGFDEAFELYEDWDLLIRSGANNPFCHVQEVTARYYQWDKDSQINRNDSLMEEARQKLFHKHRDRKTSQTALPEEKEEDKTDAPPVGQKFYAEQMAIEYANYIAALNELEDNEETKRKKSEQFTYRPKISILTPVYNVDEKWLRLAIESVINQAYDNWELCLCDGGSTKPYIKTVIEGYAARDKRIKAKYLCENKGISGNSNEALALAGGEFVCLLDHDDELAPSALYEVVKLLNEDLELDFIYTDEDKISADGKRFEPHFKPDWSPDSFRSYNYITHLAAIRKKIIDGGGGFRSEFDGSQDYDLFLRIVERTQKIAHIPKVLYHWRSHALSAAGDSTVKMYAYDSAKRALKEHIQRIGFDGVIYDGPFLGLYRIKYHLKAVPPVTIIIPTKDRADILRKCIESILTLSTYDNYEILIVDNRSTESETFQYYAGLKADPRIRVISYDGPFNYSSINNYAVRHTDSEYILFLSNGTEIISCDWIEAMLEFVQRNDVGAAGAALFYHDNTICHAGTIIGLFGVAGQPFQKLNREATGYFGRNKIIQNLSAVSDACLMTKKEIFETVGGFDAAYRYAYGDIDFCMKLRESGRLIVYTPYAQLYNHKSLTLPGADIEKHKRTIEGMRLFRVKWKSAIEKGDPYYNPNLTLLCGDFSIKKIAEFVQGKGDTDAFGYALIEAYGAQIEALARQKNAHINELENYGAQLNALLRQKDAHISELENYGAQLDALLSQKNAHISELENYGAQLNALLSQKDTHISELENYGAQLEALIRQKDARISELEVTVKQVAEDLKKICSSRGWKFLHAWYELRKKLREH